jgi:hypothetical protein
MQAVGEVMKRDDISRLNDQNGSAAVFRDDCLVRALPAVSHPEFTCSIEQHQ